MKKVSEVMTRELLTVRKDTTVRELAELFISKRFSSLPVVDESGRLIGIVTESDLIEQGKNVHLPTVITLFDWVIYLETEKTLERELKRMGGRTVADIFKSEVTTINADAPVSEAADIMSSQHINAIPVLENGKLAGIISRLDIIRTLVS